MAKRKLNVPLGNMQRKINSVTKCLGLILRSAIEELPNLLLSFFTEISHKTGWAFSLIGGGPDPINGGRIRTLRLAQVMVYHDISCTHYTMQPPLRE